MYRHIICTFINLLNTDHVKPTCYPEGQFLYIYTGAAKGGVDLQELELGSPQAWLMKTSRTELSWA
jgi:hypothetical protein